MDGLTLSKRYFFDIAKHKLEIDFPDLFPYIAAGLVGNGSECFGFDDLQSRDHDWGVDFFIWIPEEKKSYISNLVSWKKDLFSLYPPENVRIQSDYGASITVQTCGDFYKSLVGVSDTPKDIIQWFKIPETNLAMCVNGEVFLDNYGEFTLIRQNFLNYYPEDFRLKKIAAKCMAIAQTGQYNLKRMYQREEYITVHTVISKFIDAVIGLVFLLNRIYRPYYKWESKMMRSLPILGKAIDNLILDLISLSPISDGFLLYSQSIINNICSLLQQELINQKLSNSNDWFFTAHGEEVQRRITNNFIRSLPTNYE